MDLSFDEKNKRIRDLMDQYSKGFQIKKPYTVEEIEEIMRMDYLKNQKESKKSLK